MNGRLYDAQEKRESMPFTIRIVRENADLEKVVEIRRMAYGRHLPAFAEKLGIEECDRDPGVAVLLAESKLDGAPLGTMRIQTNEYAPLAVEQSVRLPDWLAGSRLAEATRLGVAGGGVGRVVKVMLCKALWLYCEQQLVDYMVITARSPLDREYEGMLFEDVFGEKEFLPMAHVGGLPHRVLAKDVDGGAAPLGGSEASVIPVHGAYASSGSRFTDVGFIFPAGTGTMPGSTANCLRQVIEE